MTRRLFSLSWLPWLGLAQKPEANRPAERLLPLGDAVRVKGYQTVGTVMAITIDERGVQYIVEWNSSTGGVFYENQLERLNPHDPYWALTR